MRNKLRYYCLPVFKTFQNVTIVDGLKKGGANGKVYSGQVYLIGAGKLTCVSGKNCKYGTKSSGWGPRSPARKSRAESNSEHQSSDTAKNNSL